MDVELLNKLTLSTALRTERFLLLGLTVKRMLLLFDHGEGSHTSNDKLIHQVEQQAAKEARLHVLLLHQVPLTEQLILQVVD
jgi:hypothetical protein